MKENKAWNYALGWTFILIVICIIQLIISNFIKPLTMDGISLYAQGIFTGFTIGSLAVFDIFKKNGRRRKQRT